MQVVLSYEGTAKFSIQVTVHRQCGQGTHTLQLRELLLRNLAQRRNCRGRHNWWASIWFHGVFSFLAQDKQPRGDFTFAILGKLSRFVYFLMYCKASGYAIWKGNPKQYIQYCLFKNSVLLPGLTKHTLQSLGIIKNKNKTLHIQLLRKLSWRHWHNIKCT